MQPISSRLAHKGPQRVLIVISCNSFKVSSAAPAQLPATTTCDCTFNVSKLFKSRPF